MMHVGDRAEHTRSTAPDGRLASAAYRSPRLESLYRVVTPLLDQLLFPQRLVTRALDDLHRMASAAEAVSRLTRDVGPFLEHVRTWMDDTDATLRSLRDEARGVRTTIEPMGEDVRILKDEFGRANDEIARLREAFGPQLEALRHSADALERELRQVRDAVRALARDADEISDVVEPLQSATDRVGKLADRLPGGNS
jgi:methyl-accepting chemotaxis protein